MEDNGGNNGISTGDKAEINEEEEVEVKPVAEIVPTPEILEWRTKAQATESPNAKDDFVRLRFFRLACHLLEQRNQYFTIEIHPSDTDNPKPTLEVNYIEFQHTQFRSDVESNDLVIYGSGKPHQIISIGGINPKPSDSPTEIVTFDISDSGNYATSAYFNDNVLHIDVWDIRLKGDRGDSKDPQIVNTPYAHIQVDQENTTDLGLSISSNGSRVTLHGLEEDGVPFRHFKTVPVAPADKDLSQPWKLEQSETIIDGSYYFIVSFYRNDRTNFDEEHEKIITSDGCTFAVYSIQGKWTQLYSIDMQAKLDMKTASIPFTSIQGGYFAWMGTSGVITIWNFETGQLVSHIYTGTESQIGEPCISPDGTMIAIPVDNSIQIRDIFTGVKLGIFKKGLTNDTLFEVVLGRDYFMTYNADKSTSSRMGEHNARSIVRVRDFSTIRTIDLHQDYHVEYPQNSDEPTFAFYVGGNINVIKLGPILSPTLEKKCGVDIDCERTSLEILELYPNCRYNVNNANGTAFIVTSVDLFRRDDFITEVEVIHDNGNDIDSPKRMKIPLGFSDFEYTATFVPGSSQLVFVANDYIHVWDVSETATRLCELNFVWKYQPLPEGVLKTDFVERDIVAAAACVHGKSIKIELAKPEWYREGLSDALDIADQQIDTITIPITKEDTLGTTEEFRRSEGLVYLIQLFTYGESDEDVQKSVIRFMKSHVRPTLKNPTSCLIALCKNWEPKNRKTIESMISQVLPAKFITWIPEFPINKETDPLALILNTAKTRPTAIVVAKVIMSYCVNRAVYSRNLAFLAPIFASFHEVMELVPEYAFECLGRIAFIPVMDRSYIVDNSKVIHAPRFHLGLWKPIDKPLYEMKDPILQLDLTSDEPDPSNEKFTRPVFMASFDALWYYPALPSTSDAKEPLGVTRSPMAETTNWWKTLYHKILLKSHLRIHNYVECYDFDIEFFDNPAIAALVAYKWNTIGFSYWIVRFIFQCCFYVLVTIAALLQVYHKEHVSELVGLFIAIIVLAAVFVWLELLQAIRNLHRYTKSGYNVLDMFAFVLPLVASIDQLAVIYTKDTAGNTRLVSFSVLVVFIHMLFELRINKSVCKYVTIIQQTVIEIKVFFFILAGGILAFTISTLHLLRACPYEGAEGCPEVTTDFPDHFVAALSATYFFMGGRLDPVDKEFGEMDWAFHLMMAIFFFFTVIVMLNVLIALINVAFTKGDDGWRLVWNESRLRYIESAENMSYHIPGYRQTYNCFPKEIYFTATLQQVREYSEKYSKDKNEPYLEITEAWLRGEFDYDEFAIDDKDEDEDEKPNDGSDSKKPNGDGSSATSNQDNENEDNVDGLKVTDAEAEVNDDSQVDKPKTEGSLVPSSSNENDKDFVNNLNQQVIDLKLQVTELQKQLTEQVLDQKGQAQKQFEELKNLLLQRG
ncbi:hypothetical protein BGZ76_005643 [Entomortierella beljakovae]|nr:hypothetical protein BGZ76_005643 [Entomortierella beljakovae]